MRIVGVDLDTKSMAYYVDETGESERIEIPRSAIEHPLLFFPVAAKLTPVIQRGTIVAIDWSPLAVFWGRRRAEVIKAVFVGVLGSFVFSNLGIPLIIPPSAVRKAFGLSRTARKSEVWNCLSLSSEVDLQKLSSPDQKDAAAIAVATRKILWGSPRES